MSKHTPGPWRVDTIERMGEVQDYFVSAADVNGFAYRAEILGDDEYRENLERKKADCKLIAESPAMFEALALVTDSLTKALTGGSVSAREAGRALQLAGEVIARIEGQPS